MINPTYLYHKGFVFNQRQESFIKVEETPDKAYECKQKIERFFSCLKIPIRKSMKRMMVLRRGGILYILIGYPEITISYRMVQGNPSIFVRYMIINKYIL